jgi:hypothetical protein
MSPLSSGNRRSAAGCVLIGSLLVGAVRARADTVVMRRGSPVEGTVVSVDAERVVVETGSGRVLLSRSEVASIEFTPSNPPLRVELRNLRSDDAVEVLLNDEVVLEEAREGGGWVDLTPKLKDGNNALRLRIRNDRGTWAYRLALRINDRVVPVACGTPFRPADPCRCCGKNGHELGVLDDLPPVWIFVDRGLGKAEVLP